MPSRFSSGDSDGARAGGGRTLSAASSRRLRVYEQWQGNEVRARAAQKASAGLMQKNACSRRPAAAAAQQLCL